MGECIVGRGHQPRFPLFKPSFVFHLFVYLFLSIGTRVIRISFVARLLMLHSADKRRGDAIILKKRIYISCFKQHEGVNKKGRKKMNRDLHHVWMEVVNIDL